MSKLRIASKVMAGIIFFGYLWLGIVKSLTGATKSYALSTMISEISFVLISLPLPALLVWAAYNLSPEKRAVNFVLWILKLSLLLTCLGLFVLVLQSLRLYLQIFSDYLEADLIILLDTTIYYIYSLGEICLLLFAIKQLSQSQIGASLSDVPEKKSKGIIKKLRILGDKTKVP